MKNLILFVSILSIVACSPAEFSTVKKDTLNSQQVCPGCGSVPTPPQVSTTGTVTILLALGDQINNDLIIKGASAQLIAENVISFASPVVNPKILVVRDKRHNGETKYDTDYIASNLLQRHDTHFIEEPDDGLKDSDVEGYDVVWFNNPGHPMGSNASKGTLKAFKGGVVLSGDDMSRGVGFDMSDLTGLRHIDNGVTVSCGGQNYNHDNHAKYRYSVTLNENLVPTNSQDLLSFEYANDIDNTELIGGAGFEVLATAVGGASSCVDERPVIVRYEK